MTAAGSSAAVGSLPSRLVSFTIADSDSYVKWGAALTATMPADWRRSLFVLENPVRPSASQLDSALDGIDSSFGHSIVTLRALADRVRTERPDVVLLALRGPLVKVVVRAIVAASERRPVIISGLPGISIPATRRAIAHRAQADLFVLHSQREIREFTALADTMGVPQKFVLASLPFLPHRMPGDRADGDVVFAAQAKVPPEREQRLALLGWLAESARRHPYRRVIVKVRARRGEQQTHAEAHDYETLLGQLNPAAPSNLVIAGGSMAAHLARAAALVTVSSTAAVEAIALDVPTLILDSFGVSGELINTVFEGSGLLGGCGDLVDGRFSLAAAGWRADNYFHDPAKDDWIKSAETLAAARAVAALPLKPLRHGVAGGVLRRAWDRKRALRRFDRSISGLIALSIGLPARGGYRFLKSGLRRRGAVVDPGAAQFERNRLSTSAPPGPDALDGGSVAA